MLLSNLLESFSNEKFIYLERKVNDSFYADVSEKYRPLNGADSFRLPFVSLNLDDLDYFEASPDHKVKEHICFGEKIRFFIHPEMIPTYQKMGIKELTNISGNFTASPTSSTRTVITLDHNPAFMVKTDLEKKLGDGIRQLKRKQVNHSYRVCQDLNSAKLPSSFAYLPESMGAVYSFNGFEVGMIIRELGIKPQNNQRSCMFPLFSLFCKDFNNNQDPLLLTQLLENQTSSSKRCFDIFREQILSPYINSWAHLILNRGLQLEMHAQNTLLETDENGKVSRVIYRDLQDVFVDLKIRAFKNLGNLFERNILGQPERAYKTGNKLITDPEKCRQISYSLVYDYRIGRALDLFSEALETGGYVLKKDFIAATKEIWDSNFKGTEIFPKKAYYLKPNQHNLERELVFIEEDPKYR